MSKTKRLTILGNHFLINSEFNLSSHNAWEFSDGNRSRVDHLVPESEYFKNKDWQLSLKVGGNPSKKIVSFLQSQLDLNCGILELNFFSCRLLLAETEFNSHQSPEELLLNSDVQESIKQAGLDSELSLNNILYHPLLSTDNLRYENDTLGFALVSALVTPEISAKIAKLDYLIITGEAFWSGWFSLAILHKFLNKYAQRDIEVVFDKSGIWQMLLYKSEADPQLLKLDKSFFLPDLTYKHWLNSRGTADSLKIDLATADGRKKQLYWEVTKRAGFFDLETSEFTYENKPLGRYLGLKEQKPLVKISKKGYQNWWKTTQTDYLVTYTPATLTKSLQLRANLSLFAQHKLEVKVKTGEQIGPGTVLAKELGIDALKIWVADDYSLEVRDAELVREGQVLAKKTKAKGLFNKEIKATAAGKISLKHLAEGYLLLEKSKQERLIESNFEARFIRQTASGNSLIFETPLELIPLKHQIGKGFSGILHSEYQPKLETEQVLYLAEFNGKTQPDFKQMPYLAGVIIGKIAYGDLVKLVKEMRFLNIAVLGEFNVSLDRQLDHLLKQHQANFVCIEENELKIPLKMLLSQKTKPSLQKGAKVQTLTFSNQQIYGNLEKVFADGKLLISDQKELWEGDLVNIFLLNYEG